jgi:hypothetical protein
VSAQGEVEMIVEYGFRQDSEIIPSIIVSDGDPNRTNRNLMLSAVLKCVGISIHEHMEYDYMVVILLCESIRENKGCPCTIF